MKAAKRDERGSLNLGAGLWAVAVAAVLVSVVIVTGMIVVQHTDDSSRVQSQLADLQDSLSAGELYNRELSEQLRDQASEYQRSQLSWQSVLTETEERLKASRTSESELRQQLAAAVNRSEADRQRLENELKLAQTETQNVARAALNDLQAERAAREEINEQLDAYQKAYEQNRQELVRLAETQQATRDWAQEQASLRLDAEEAARAEAERAQQVQYAAQQALAVEASRRYQVEQIAAAEAQRRYQAEQAAAIEARRRAQAERELRNRINERVGRIDQELIPARSRFKRDMDEFNKMSADYTTRLNRVQNTYDTEMKDIRKIYHAAIDRGEDPEKAKDERKAREAAAQRIYDAGMSRLTNVDKPKLNELKEQIRKTSSRIAELEQLRENARQGRF